MEKLLQRAYRLTKDTKGVFGINVMVSAELLFQAELIINTATTIVTFLMVFLIQNTQNRDTEAIQIKLDELIRATQGAHNALLDLEDLEDQRLDEFRSKYRVLAATARSALEKGDCDTDTPDT